MTARFNLYWNTLRRLHPEQIRHQLRRRFPASTPDLVARDGARERSGWGWSVARCRGAAARGELVGRFRHWNVERELDLRHRWEAPDLGPAWNYPVHYFEAAPALATAAVAGSDVDLRDALCRALDLWIEAHPMGTSIGWDPYPTALRIVNWLDVVWTLGEWSNPAWRKRVLESVHAQAGWVEAHLERHLLGTHLLKDAKALVFAGSVFSGADAARWSHRGQAMVGRESHRQVHADGGHLEPSVYYHGIALEDLLDLVNLGSSDAALCEALVETAMRMLDMLVAVLPPDGAWPLLGDAARDATPYPRELLSYARRLGLAVPEAVDGLRILPDSGLAVWRDSRQFLLADIGPIGPPHLSGHGHCDSLSFEWFVDGMPFVVDSGTGSYEQGPERSASRSTQAHNTLEIDAYEQHEIWAAFRVARRSEVHAEPVGKSAVQATLVPWHDDRLRVTRRFDFEPATVRIRDRIEGSGRHAITSRLHFHPDCSVNRQGNDLLLRHGTVDARIILPPDATFELLDPLRSESSCCVSFGEARPNAVVRIAWQGALPWTCEMELVAASRGPF